MNTYKSNTCPYNMYKQASMAKVAEYDWNKFWEDLQNAFKGDNAWRPMIGGLIGVLLGGAVGGRGGALMGGLGGILGGAFWDNIGKWWTETAAKNGVATTTPTTTPTPETGNTSPASTGTTSQQPEAKQEDAKTESAVDVPPLLTSKVVGTPLQPGSAFSPSSINSDGTVNFEYRGYIDPSLVNPNGITQEYVNSMQPEKIGEKPRFTDRQIQERVAAVPQGSQQLSTIRRFFTPNSTLQKMDSARAKALDEIDAMRFAKEPIMEDTPIFMGKKAQYQAIVDMVSKVNEHNAPYVQQFANGVMRRGLSEYAPTPDKAKDIRDSAKAHELFDDSWKSDNPAPGRSTPHGQSTYLGNAMWESPKRTSTTTPIRSDMTTGFWGEADTRKGPTYVDFTNLTPRGGVYPTYNFSFRSPGFVH